jgi:hypothetical protein
MRKLLIGTAALFVLATPAFAADNKPGVTAADAAKVVAGIQADKEKVKIYCEMADLYNQASQASEKDAKKADELAGKADALGAKLGADYEKLSKDSADQDPDSPEGKKVAAEFEKLDGACAKK